MLLLDLPPEIILCIADKLDQARDLLMLACLNRAANALCWSICSSSMSDANAALPCFGALTHPNHGRGSTQRHFVFAKTVEPITRRWGLFCFVQGNSWGCKEWEKARWRTSISPGTVNFYVLCALHTNFALTPNGPADSEPCEVPFSCFVGEWQFL